MMLLYLLYCQILLNQSIMLRNLLATIFFIILSSSVALGQSHYFKHYQVENGLSNNTVFCIIQDSSGFMWMGTKDGLNRFDGYNYKVFRNEAEDMFSIGDNFIRSLYLDNHNNLYIGTRKGVYLYNRVLENFSLVYETLSEVRGRSIQY